MNYSIIYYRYYVCPKFISFKISKMEFPRLQSVNNAFQDSRKNKTSRFQKLEVSKCRFSRLYIPKSQIFIVSNVQQDSNITKLQASKVPKFENPKLVTFEIFKIQHLKRFRTHVSNMFKTLDPQIQIC